MPFTHFSAILLSGTVNGNSISVRECKPKTTVNTEFFVLRSIVHFH